MMISGVFILVAGLDLALGFVNLADVECGMVFSRHARIIGGENASPEEVPWAASLWRNGVHLCGATVINDRWLLTAGHCICSTTDVFYTSKQLSAVVGYTDLSQTDDKEAIASILPHPDYRCGKKQNDVALLKTAKQLTWTNELRPACLPKPKAEDFSGSFATVAGWGFTDEERKLGTKPDVLQKTNVVVVTNDQCSSWYESSGYKIKVTGTQMCAGFEDGGRDSCWADSGGPLLFQTDKARTMVIGVVSTGIGCGRPKRPGIYTRVSKYTEWIVEIVNEKTKGLNWYKGAF